MDRTQKVFLAVVFIVSVVASFCFAGMSVEPRGYNIAQYETMTSTFGAPSYKNIVWTSAVSEIEIVCISTHPTPTLYVDWWDLRTSTHQSVFTTNAEKLDYYNVSFATTTSNNACWIRKYYTGQTTIYVDTNTVNSCPLNIRVTGRGWKW